MSRVLVLFAHPALEKSRVHRRMLARVPRREDVTLHDLYERYPAFDVDVPREQALLAAHDVVVLQHPLYWYSVPALLKQWMDLVLEHGWAYGSRGRALAGKAAVSAVTAGGIEAAYRHEGLNRSTLDEILIPLERTFALCRMTWRPPWARFGTHRMEAPDIAATADAYGAFLDALADGRIDWDADDPYDALAAGATRGEA